MTMDAAAHFEFTEMMNTALRFINSTGRHIFLTGKAGTGKTTFLRQLTLRTHKQAAIIAPTGIAALNAGGTTIHSQFLFPFGMFIPDRSYAEPPEEGANWYTESVLARRHPLNSARKQVLRSIDLLIIDEVSMLRADLLDAIDYRLRSVRGNFSQGFGGVQLLLIGDLYQLPPVVKRTEESRIKQYYNSLWFFESKGLKRDGFVYIELNKIFRQRDQEFINVLNNLRTNRPTTGDLALLNQHYKTPEEIDNTKDVITLTTHNNMADSMNLKALQALDTSSSFFTATIENDFPESMYPVLYRLELKVGAQIMFTRNDSEDGAYFNGKLATIHAIAGENITVVMSGSGLHYKLRRSVWENKRYAVSEMTKELEEEVVGTFSQYPIKLAWAITVHKSQGLTFDKAIIDVGQAFADGQVYVALSRLRSLDGLMLRTKVDPSIVTTDKQIVSFDQANNRPHALNDEIKDQQREFILRQINKTFDFTMLVKELSYISKDSSATESFGEATMKSVLSQIADSLSTQGGHTAKFREQLKGLLGSGTDDELLDRIRKGATYYKNLLQSLLKQLLIHLEEMKSQKRVKGYLSDLGDFDQLLSKKLEEVDKILFIVEGIVKGDGDFDFEKLKTERATERQILVKEISALVPTVPVKKKRKKSDKKTHTISIELLNQGLRIEEIAEQRQLTVGTIESHLAKGVKLGALSIFEIMGQEDIELIRLTVNGMSDGFRAGELHQKLKGKFSYGMIRAAVTHLGITAGGEVDIPE